MAGQYYSYQPYMGADPDSRLSLYDSSQLLTNTRVLGPQGFADAVAFWYRPEPSESMFEREDAAQVRQGVTGASQEHIKHRRTRSGCYTCRSRRVKCDEKRPVCERCQKGNRDCVYPEASGSSKSGGRAKAGDSRSHRKESPSSDEQDAEDSKLLNTILDEDEDEDEIADSGPKVQASATKTAPSPVAKRQSNQSLGRRRGARQQSESSSNKDVTSPSTEASASFSGTHTPASSLRTMPSNSTIRSGPLPVSSTKWSHLRQDLQFYLQYHQDHISSFHYFFKMDQADFIHTDLIDLAIGFEPLQYAIVGFSAYHHTLRQPTGKLSLFLTYYSRSLSLLRKSLEARHKNTEATVLTILTLATFEEYLGDWINLIGHHRAAHQMIVEAFSPEMIMDTEVHRQLFLWCARFDVIAGLMGGNDTSLDREWYTACEDWYLQQIENDPNDIGSRLGAVTACNRLVGFDMAGLLSRLPRGTISMEDFIAQYEDVGVRIDNLRLRIQNLNDGDYTVTDYGQKEELGPDDIVNPYVPGGLFTGPLFVLNYTYIDWFAIKLMYRYQYSTIMKQSPPPELGLLALEQCRIFETIQRWPDSPPGAELGAHASLGIATVFLPKDQRHTMWARRQLARMEAQGYIYPPTFRIRMAEMWHLPEINHWWLPNDEGYQPILQSIRAFNEERASQPPDHRTEDLRDMKAIFSKLNIDDSPRDSPSAGSGSGSIVGGGPSTQSPSMKESPGSVGEGPPAAIMNEDESVQDAPGATGDGQYLSGDEGKGRRGDRMSGIWEGGNVR